MIPSAELSKAPYPISWILNEKNMKYKTDTTALWYPKHNKQLWFHEKLYYFKEGRVFDMNHHVCGYIENNTVYGPKFKTKIEIHFDL